MWFFDITPLGRIIARFTSDMDKVDFMLSITLQYALFGILNIISAVVLISIITPWFLLLCGILFFLYYFLLRMYLYSGRDVKRIVDVIRGPLISRYQEANMGLIQIRSSNKMNYFLRFFDKTVNQHTRACFHEAWGQRWMGMITETLASFLIGGCAFFGVYAKN